MLTTRRLYEQWLVMSRRLFGVLVPARWGTGLLRLALGLALVSASGCTLIDMSDHVSYRHEGLPLGESGLDSVVIGKTDKTWLLTHAGEPDMRQQLSSTEEQWGYVFEVQTTSRLRVFPILTRTSRTAKAQIVYFHLRNGKVIRSWQQPTQQQEAPVQAQATQNQAAQIQAAQVPAAAGSASMSGRTSGLVSMSSPSPVATGASVGAPSAATAFPAQ